jgi:BirA family transcriptional regulator, biotin operon repressor / biotin---[acetyl-CoA-carboxylase] ligase
MALHFLDSTASVMEDMRVWARGEGVRGADAARDDTNKYAQENDWIHADVQSAGRGRQTRVWQSLKGNLHTCGLVRLRESDPPVSTLALVAGLAVLHAVQEAAPRPDYQLKWPNDVLLNGAKLAGILLECEGACVLVGVGVNLAHAADIPERAVADLGGMISPSAFLPRLAEHFTQGLALWRQESIATLITQWERAAHPIGSDLKVQLEGKIISGAFAGLCQDAGKQGALLLRLQDGTLTTITAGDVERVTRR